MNWIPVRSGKLYCSPACGGKCTYASWLQAKAKAEALAKRMGNNWEPVIHENLGWHYCAATKDGRFRVYEDTPGQFSACLSPGSFWVRSVAPKDAFKKVILAVKKQAAETLKLIEGYET